MDRRAIVIAASLLVLIVIAMFMFAYIKRQELTQQEPEPAAVEGVDAEGLKIERVDAKHFYREGRHTVAGEIAMPTPCDLLEANVAVLESFPETAIIGFSVINNSEGQCAQVVTPQRFKVSFEASEDAKIEGRFMGEPLILNLVRAGEDEDPDDFELFIKG